MTLGMDVPHFYRHLLEDGYACVILEVDRGLYHEFASHPEVKEWRKQVRQEAKRDRIKVRTIASGMERTVLAVRVGWEPDDETRTKILGWTGVHVCPAYEFDRGIPLLAYVRTAFCPHCGEEMPEENGFHFG